MLVARCMRYLAVDFDVGESRRLSAPVFMYTEDDDGVYGADERFRMASDPGLTWETNTASGVYHTREISSVSAAAMGGGVAHVVQWQHRGEDAKWLAGASAWSWHQAGNNDISIYLHQASSLGTHHINQTQSLAAINSNIASFQPTPHTAIRSRHAHFMTLPHALTFALAPSIRYITRPTATRSQEPLPRNNHSSADNTGNTNKR